MWKKVCPDEYKRLRIIRRKRKREHDDLYDLRSKGGQGDKNPTNQEAAAGNEVTTRNTASPKSGVAGAVSGAVASPNKEKTYICQFSSCNAVSN